MLVDVASTMWPGSEFHASITRLEKKCRLSSNLALGFWAISWYSFCVGQDIYRLFSIIEIILGNYQQV